MHVGKHIPHHRGRPYMPSCNHVLENEQPIVAGADHLLEETLVWVQWKRWNSRFEVCMLWSKIQHEIYINLCRRSLPLARKVLLEFLKWFVVGNLKACTPLGCLEYDAFSSIQVWQMLKFDRCGLLRSVCVCVLSHKHIKQRCCLLDKSCMRRLCK